jgi:hypothetical protein
MLLKKSGHHFLMFRILESAKIFIATTMPNEMSKIIATHSPAVK